MKRWKVGIVERLKNGILEYRENGFIDRWINGLEKAAILIRIGVSLEDNPEATSHLKNFKSNEKKMNMKVLTILSLIAAGMILSGCGKAGGNVHSAGDSSAAAGHSNQRKVLYWYDPMNPTVHFDHPGKSPFMDMDLQPMYADEMESDPNIVVVDPAMVQNIGVVTAPVERRKLTRTITTYGVVAPDEKSITDINTRVSGWIEQLYFDYTGMEIRKGQPMAVIYSPELIAAEQEFLQAVSFASVSANVATHHGSLVESARERLKFFGMNSEEIDKLRSTGQVIDRVVIHSPANGVILEKNVFEGEKISEGQSLFTVADLRHVWILADVFRIDMPFLKLRSPATVAYNSSESYEGKVDFIYPEVDAAARSVKIRIPLSNPGMTLKVGQYVNVAIHSPVSYDALAVPAQAVINTGLRQVVAVALGEGRFEMRDVRLGAYADGYYEVLGGLDEGDVIVTSGQFLIDSDANLRSAGDAMAGMSETGVGKQEAGGDPGNEVGSNKNGNMNDIGSMPGMDMDGKKSEVGGRSSEAMDVRGEDIGSPGPNYEPRTQSNSDMPGMDMGGGEKKEVRSRKSDRGLRSAAPDLHSTPGREH